MDNYEKKGYLVSDFRIFHLCDEPGEIPFHYHDFHKIIFFLNGNADYVIEGRSYHLEPRDIIFVAAGEIHRPVFLTPARPYDRIVIYIAPDFLERWSERDPQHADLSACFRLAGETEHVMHQTAHKNHDLLFHINKLEKTARGEGNSLYGVYDYPAPLPARSRTQNAGKSRLRSEDPAGSRLYRRTSAGTFAR